MREPERGDLVLHFCHDTWPEGIAETRLSGRSVVSRECRTVYEEPPSPGSWSGREEYYRIDLRDYKPFSDPLPLDTLLSYYGNEIRREITEREPRFYPFATCGDSLRTVQGIYLARCTSHLYTLIRQALELEASVSDTNRVAEGLPHAEYSEGIRQAHESYFFARNAALVRKAKEHYGYACQVCGFNFEQHYGELGKGFIECHHLNPLSERSEGEWSEEITSSLDDVTVLCSNCHRMVHRARPALTLEELKHRLR